MLRYVRMIIVGIALCALLSTAASSTHAGTIDTIIKLNLAGSSPNVQFDGNTFSTMGDQDTSVIFEYFLDSVLTDILTPDASFSLQDLTASGDAVVFNNSLVLQNFTGGQFSLYDESNVLLLSGDLADSALAGAIGVSTGALFTSSFSDVTGGTLASHILPGTLTLAMNLSGVVTVAGGSGFSVTITGATPPFIETGDLNPFTGNAQVSIDAAPIPEPTSIALVAIGIALTTGLVRRKRHGRC